MGTTKDKKKTVLFVVLLLTFFLILLLSFRIWMYTRFNQQGNLLLGSSDNSKIYEMTRGGLIVWNFDLPESFVEERLHPPYVKRLPNGNTLITDHHAAMIYEVNRGKRIVWKCDSLYKSGDFAFTLKYPTMALKTWNRHILIADLKCAKVVEVDRECNIIWKWDYIDDDPDFDGDLVNVYRFVDGNTAVLIHKVIEGGQYQAKKLNVIDFFEYIEIDENKKVVKRFDLNKIASHPVTAEILSNGHILISYFISGYDRYGVFEFDTLNQIIWSFQSPDSVLITNPQRKKVPAGVDAAYRFSNGNTGMYSLCLGIYVVAPDNKILWRVKHPCVKSILGIEYLTEDEEGRGDPICFLLGIVDR